MSENKELLDAEINIGKINEILSTVEAIVDECKINISKSGLNIRAVDVANVCMVDTRLESGGFETYNAEIGTIGVNLNRFLEILGMASSDSVVKLTVDADAHKLLIETENISYDLGLLDPDSIGDEPDIPDINLGASTEIAGGQISQGIKASNMVSDYVEFKFDSKDKMFSIGAEGNSDEVKVEFGNDDVESITYTDSKSIYSLEYMKKIVKPMKSKSVHLQMDDEMPIVFEFDTSEGYGSCKYLLAPRIQN